MFTECCGGRLPEGTLHSCLIPIGRVQHIHLLRQQVRVDRVVLEGLRVVRTAEECHCKGHKEKTKVLLMVKTGHSHVTA